MHDNRDPHPSREFVSEALMAKPMRDAVMTDGRQEEGGRHAEVDTEQGRQAFAGALCREISSGAHRDVAPSQTSSNRCAKLQPNETKDVQGVEGRSSWRSSTDPADAARHGNSLSLSMSKHTMAIYPTERTKIVTPIQLETVSNALMAKPLRDAVMNGRTAGRKWPTC